MSATEQLPAPLVPPEVDLRDFGFMPLDVRTLLTSSLWIKAKKDPRVAHAAMSLWCEAWHQVPAGSLPDDDEVLADLARCDAKEWARVKERALAHFVKCSDGLLYHRLVAQKAVDAWESKLAQRARTKAATEAREAKKRAQKSSADVQRHEERHEQRDVARNEQRDVERNDARDESRDVHQGTGIGTGIGIEKREKTVTGGTSPPSADPPTGHAAVSPRHPESDATASKPPKPSAKGSRLPPGWDPGETGRAFASAQGLANGRMGDELDRFRDFWTAKAGADGVKLDWQATWRNWVRRAVEMNPKATPAAHAERHYEVR